MCLRELAKALNCENWGCDHFPGPPVPVPNLGEEPFPDNQPKPTLTQLQAIPLSPVTAHQRTEIYACLCFPCGAAVDHGEVLVGVKRPIIHLEGAGLVALRGLSTGTCSGQAARLLPAAGLC